MLVLSRKVGEEIVIGDNIRVRVLSIMGNQIRLGFVAPREVSITREELLGRSDAVREDLGAGPAQP
jgi:carbon storage regulator